MFIRRLPTSCSIHIETGERAGQRPLQLRSVGFLEFAIQPRRASSVVDLQLINAEANVERFTVEIDGRQVELDGFILRGSDFDLLASQGEVDQESNEGWFRLVFTLPLGRIPELRGVIENQEPRIEIVERGKIDLSMGRIVETHADPFDIPDGIPRSLIHAVGRRQARNFKGPSCSVDRVRLGGVVSAEFSPSDVNERAQQGLLIVCPNTPIKLIWGSHDSSAVKSGKIRDNKTTQDVASISSGTGTTDVAPTDDAEYQLTITDPKCAPKSDTVTVAVVDPGQEIVISASWNASTGIATFNGNPKFIGKDVYVTSVKAVDCSGLQSPPVPLWDYAFTDRDGRVRYGQVQTVYSPIPGGDLPLSGSVWEFVPRILARDFALWACFSIRCACH